MEPTDDIIKTLPLLTEQDRRDTSHTRKELKQAAMEGLEDELRASDEAFDGESA